MKGRGDVVVARFPYVGGQGYKVRPAVVVQCDRLNQKIDNTILAMVTGNTRLASVEPSQFLIDPTTPDGATSGLAMPSAVKCENLATVHQTDILDVLGSLSRAHMLKLNDCLRSVLDLP